MGLSTSLFILPLSNGNKNVIKEEPATKEFCPTCEKRSWGVTP
jgi:hypothetical protein